MADIVQQPRLLVFDLDGTAIHSNISARMSKTLISALKNASTNGLRVSIATGRSWEHFITVIDEVRDSLAPCIISGGSQIVDTLQGVILWEVQLTQQQISALNLITSKYNKSISYNSRLNTYGPTKKIPSTDHTTIAYLLDIDPSELETIHADVSRITGLHSAITHAWGDAGQHTLHITSTDANKGAALRKLADMVNVPLHDVVAIGDGLNDIPMFEIAGTSYSIAGSVVDGYQSTEGSIADVNEDGLANYLLKLYDKY
ncbi:MAG: HAD family hydrolase [Candidatus Saccharimonadales bacterium]